jgi:hypothetical protein
MRKVEEIEQQIQSLSASEFSELRDWLLDRDWRQWDAQIESDLSAGKLDGLAAEALAEHKGGKSRAI